MQFLGLEDPLAATYRVLSRPPSKSGLVILNIYRGYFIYGCDICFEALRDTVRYTKSSDEELGKSIDEDLSASMIRSSLFPCTVGSDQFGSG